MSLPLPYQCIHKSQQSKPGFAINMAVINKKEWVAGRVGRESYSALEQEYRVNF